MTRFNAPLKQSTRRLLSIVATVIFLTSFVAAFFGETFVIPSLLLLVPYLLIVVRLNKSTSNVVSVRNNNLDERQKELRGEAYRMTYAVFVWYAFFMVVVSGLGLGRVTLTYGAGETPIVHLLLLINMFFITTLPIFYVAWLEPDPLPDDEPSLQPNAAA